MFDFPGSIHDLTGWSRRVKSSATSPEFWSGWVLQPVHLKCAENHPAGRLAIVPSLHSTTKWHDVSHHAPRDPSCGGSEWQSGVAKVRKA